MDELTGQDHSQATELDQLAGARAGPGGTEAGPGERSQLPSPDPLCDPGRYLGGVPGGAQPEWALRGAVSDAR